METIALIGGNGFIGKYIYSAVKNYYNVNIIGRNTEFDLENADYIIHTAQFTGHPVERPWLGDDHTYLGFEINIIQKILKHLNKKHKPIKQLIYLSGAGITEQAIHSEYSWIRAKGLVEQSIKNSNLPYTILRPSWVYGEGDRSMSQLINFAKYLPFFPIIGNGLNIINPVFVKDLAEIISKTLNNSDTLYKTIEIGSKEVTMIDIANNIFEVFNIKKKPLLFHPKPLMKIIGLFMQFIPQSIISPSSVDFLTMHAPIKQKDEVFGIKLNNLKEGLKQYKNS